MPHEPATLDRPPSPLIAGDTWTWRRTLGDHPPADGWTLKYQLSIDADEVALTITAEADGSSYLITVAASATTGLDPGTYRWREFVERGAEEGGSEDEEERYTLASGTLEVRAVTHESTAARMVRLITAAIEALVTGGKKQVAINSRSFTRNDLPELRAELAHWKAELEQERRPGFGPKFAATMQAPGFATGDLPFRGYL
jgi:hypothetical protein